MTPSSVAQFIQCAPIDYAVVGIYFVGVLAFGLYFGRYAKTTKDFFFGGQRFSGWLLATSVMASIVGSYSFVKYSDVGFRYGLSSSMTYLNDWFFVPILMFVWLPIIYYSRVRSVPEYFQRRFDGRTRVMSAILLMVYMVGYVGYTIFTLGKVTNHLFGVDLFAACALIAGITAVYITVGGQTAIIYTDLVQALMLIVAGVMLLVLGLLFLGQGDGLLAGIHGFWVHTPFQSRLPFAGFNKPSDFNFVGVFWQDMANSCVYFFVNQGLIMRYLAAKSAEESRKTILINSVCLLPFAVIVVGGAGWVGHAIANMAPDQLDPHTPGDRAFVVVAHLLCRPGVFGFMMAALVAALMSTVDTNVNALAAISVVDLYQPYLAPGRSDRHYLTVARIVSVVAAGAGLALVVLFDRFKSIYLAHAAFTAAVTPLLGVPVLLGVFWKRFTPAAAFGSMFIGAAAAIVSFRYPEIVRPFMDLHGMARDANPSYMRALFLLSVTCISGVFLSLVTKPKPPAEIAGLWIGSIERGRRMFKNGRPNDRRGQTIRTRVTITEKPLERAGPSCPDYPLVSLSRHQMTALAADPGDLLYVADARRYLGGLRSLHAVAAKPHAGVRAIQMNRATLELGDLRADRPVRVEKVI